MTLILDHTQDLSGTDQHRLTSLYKPPAFVKEADHDRLYGDPETMESHLYADQTHRRYPCHTAPATWMSALFFFDKQASIAGGLAPVIEERIKSAADYFHIRQQVDELQQKVATDSVDDLGKLGDNDFALVWAATETADKARHYPLRNTAEVKVAADWFTGYRDEFTYPDRQRVASKLLEKAAALGVALPQSEMLHQTAGYGYCATAGICEMLRGRADLVARSFPEHASEMRKLANIAEGSYHDVRDSALRIKIAAVVDQFDRQTKLNRMYDEGGLARPEEILFQVTEKTASGFLRNHVQLTTGTIYEKSALAPLTAELLTRWMGTDFTEAVSDGLQIELDKVADIAATLPRGDAEMFERMAQEVNIFPYAREKGAMEEGLSLTEMQELAAQYSQAGVR